jgi:transposase
VSSEQAAKRLSDAAAVIEATKKKWGIPEHIRTVVSYEAGQDGFWIHRALTALGYEVLIVDPASIPVERQARRAKTDRLDAIKLVNCLLAWLRGERDRMHVIRVPGVEAEAQRHLARDRGELQKEIQQHRDRTRKLLRTVGCWDSVEGKFADRLEQGEVRCQDGQPLPALMKARLERECARMALAETQLAALEKSMVETLPEEIRGRINQLMQLKAIGQIGAFRLVLELYWRTSDTLLRSSRLREEVRCGHSRTRRYRAPCHGRTSTTADKSAHAWDSPRSPTTAAKAGWIKASANKATGECAPC